jgi:hypothetical protein
MSAESYSLEKSEEGGRISPIVVLAMLLHQLD